MIDIACNLIKIIESHGVILEHKEYTYRQLDDAILSGRFLFIRMDEKNIGFFTWVIKGNDVFIENMLIYKQFRGKFCMIKLRKILKDIYGNISSFSWINRKQKRIKRFVQREVSLC